MGGIGKTQLAVEYAYRYAKDYPGGVYWVNAAQPVRAEFARLALAAGLTPGETADSERTMRLALAFAKHLAERHDALAIFDNVDNPLTLRSPEPGFMPEQLGCRLLFTTRRRAPDSSFETVDVRVLPDDGALRLLLGETRRALPDRGPRAELDAANGAAELLHAGRMLAPAGSTEPGAAGRACSTSSPDGRRRCPAITADPLVRRDPGVAYPRSPGVGFHGAPCRRGPQCLPRHEGRTAPRRRRAMTDLNVAFWNVQNLFEPGAVDRGPRSDAELSARLDVLTRVIGRLFGGNAPHLLGLAEIHTDRIFDMVRERLGAHYHAIWEESGSSLETGLGLLARKDMFTEIRAEGVQRPGMFKRPRCLLARCELQQAREPLLVAVNHWKSRRPVKGLSPEDDRVETARWLGERLATSTRATCAIVLGDFNAEPFERPFNERSLRSVRFFSSALWARATPAYLYNTAWRFLAEPDYWEDFGVVKEDAPRSARGADVDPPLEEYWNEVSPGTSGKREYHLPRPQTSHGDGMSVIFDQLLVSGHALRGGPVTLKERSVVYHCDADTSERKRTAKVVPRPWTYDGRVGVGASDHFPLTATFRIDGGKR
jgi:endonuclease/exonuclease/phosphatase family metal-dependent hydrolase